MGFWLSSDSVSSVLSEVAVGVSGLSPCPHGFSFAGGDLVLISDVCSCDKEFQLSSSLIIVMYLSALFFSPFFLWQDRDGQRVVRGGCSWWGV